MAAIEPDEHLGYPNLGALHRISSAIASRHVARVGMSALQPAHFHTCAPSSEQVRNRTTYTSSRREAQLESTVEV